MRLAVYEDAVYHRDAAGRLTAERVFPMFMAGLAEEIPTVVVLGRLRPGASTAHYPLPAGVEFSALPHYAALTEPLQVARALGGTLRTFWGVLARVDAVWLNGPSPMAVLALALALARRRRVILGVRQNTMQYARARHPGRRATLLAFRLMEGIWRTLGRRLPVTAVGPELAALYGRGAAVHELAVSLVSERDIAPPFERDYGEEITLLSVGRLETEKNPLLLADVLAELAQGGGRWRLRVVGEGDLRDALEDRLSALGVRDRAELVGYVPLDRGLFDLYRRSHVFLHISWTEGLPQVLLEAFASRLPTVATDVGGVGAVAGDAALLIPPGDAVAAAAAVRRVAADASLRRQLTEAGLARVRGRTTEAERRRLARFLLAGG